MKKLIFILFTLLFSLIVSATNYYVKEGGNDSASGLDDDNAWESISKVNSFSFTAGDTCFFKRGDNFTGTLTPSTSGNSGSYIVFAAYGTGVIPIITPNTVVGGVTWTVHSGSIYKTTDLGYDPGNMLMGDNRLKILKINNAYFTTGANGYYNNYGALTLMAFSEAVTYEFSTQNVVFWDGLDALYCYNSGTTYIRFRGGEDPNDSTFYTSVEDSRVVFINTKRYIALYNLHLLGGETGVDLYNINYTGTDNIVIKNCKIEGSNRKVLIRTGSRGITVQNCMMTTTHISPYTGGAYNGATTYTAGVDNHLYTFIKYRVATGSSDAVDQGVAMTNGSRDNNYITGDTIINCNNGIGIYGANNVVTYNYMENGSSAAILIDRTAEDFIISDNYIVNYDNPFRLQYVDQGSARTGYMYRNRIFNPDAGQFMYIHYGPDHNPSQVTAYFYHNSVISYRGVNCSYYAYFNPGYGTGISFVNNIISTTEYAFYSNGWSGMDNFEGLFTVNHNWISGQYYGASSEGIAVWANGESNFNYPLGPTFWDHEVDPPDFTDIEDTEVIGAGSDVSLIYDAAGNVFLNPTPAIGAYEIPPVAPTLVESIDVWGTGGATTISSEGGTLQMLKKTLPTNSTDTTVVWSVISGTGTAEISIGGLLTATSDGTVDVRATASDDSGIYGEEEITISNQNPDAGLPIVTTDGIHSRTSVSAIFGGEVISQSGGTVTARGVCWNTSADPTTANSKTVDGAGLGIFTSSLTGLKGNTTYYVRAYATNEEGTAYGDNVSFTTPKITVLIGPNGERLTSGMKGQKYLIISR